MTELDSDGEIGPIQVDSMKQALAWVQIAKRSGQMFCVLIPSHPVPILTLVKPCPLSRREIEILQLYADGYSLAQTAKVLRLSKLTVKSHQHRIARKITNGNGAKELLVAVALRARWIR